MDFAKRICEAGDDALHDPKYYAIYKNEANRHHKNYLDHNRRRQEHKAKVKAQELQEKKKNRGLKKICRAIDAKCSKPLIAARRKQVGPKGQPIGTIATSPKEVDEIVKESWSQIYRGNEEDHEAAAKKFLEEYKEFLYKQTEEENIGMVTGAEIKEACQDAAETAAGLDIWSPSDFRMLSDKAYEWLAVLLNTIEEGAEWPEQLLHGRAAFLEKDEDDRFNPLAFRVLLILPTLYRRWASMRLATLAPWIKKWQVRGKKMLGDVQSLLGVNQKLLNLLQETIDAGGDIGLVSEHL